MVLLKDKTGADYKDPGKGKKGALVKLADYNRYFLLLKDLNYSVRLHTGQAATLAMELTIVLGMFQDEMDKKQELSEEDWKKYMTAIGALDSDIREKWQK